VAAWPGLWPAPNVNNTLGTTASTLDPLISFEPLASLVNGKVPCGNFHECAPSHAEIWQSRGLLR
jgi:hypothetical protein